MVVDFERIKEIFTMYDKQAIPQRINWNLPDGQGLRKGILGQVTMNFRMESSKIECWNGSQFIYPEM